MSNNTKKSSGMTNVRNSTVRRESISSCESDVSVTDLQYELFYSLSENDDTDRIFYDFDTVSAKHVDNCEGNNLKKVDRKISTHSRTSVVSFSGSVKCNRSNERQKRHSKTSSIINEGTGRGENPPCAIHYGNSSTDVQNNETKIRHKSASSSGSYRSCCCSIYNKQHSLIDCQFPTESQRPSRCNSVGTGRSQSQTEMSDVTDKTTVKKIAIQRKKSVSYDPALDKASAFLHSGGKSFSRANTSLNPVRYGLKHIQTNYTESNLENNNSRIFLDLLKSSHQKNYIRNTSIRNLETRLEAKRNNPHFFTSFYDHNKIPDPLGRNNKKNVARSVAQKKLERKEKIKSTTDELHMGYIPTALTMKHADQEETEDIGKNCRYLRCRGPSIRPSVNRTRSASGLQSSK